MTFRGAGVDSRMSHALIEGALREAQLEYANTFRSTNGTVPKEVRQQNPAWKTEHRS